MRAMVIQITLKSGAQIKVKATEFSASPSRVTWTNANGAHPQLVRVDPTEVAAVVRLK